MKVGVFDSGIGGITVLNELRRRFPYLDFVYLGDTANVPYGTKSASQIKLLATAAATFLGARSVDALVVACNTASCVAIEEIRKVMGEVPVFGVVEAGVATVTQAFKDADRNCPVLILGTRATVRSHVYAGLLKNSLGPRSVIVEQECPLLVPLIEEGWIDHPILHQTVAEYVKSAAALQPGIALLGCTHYPWIRGPFEAALPGWKVVDSAFAIGEALSQILNENESKQQARAGRVEWFFSDEEAVPNFVRTASELKSEI